MQYNVHRGKALRKGSIQPQLLSTRCWTVTIRKPVDVFNSAVATANWLALLPSAMTHASVITCSLRSLKLQAGSFQQEAQPTAVSCMDGPSVSVTHTGPLNGKTPPPRLAAYVPAIGNNTAWVAHDITTPNHWWQAATHCSQRASQWLLNFQQSGCRRGSRSLRAVGKVLRCKNRLHSVCCTAHVTAQQCMHYCTVPLFHFTYHALAPHNGAPTPRRFVANQPGWS